ncbi:universal stress protein [Jhaorihella thermophila]|uniref:universal stress protein n=1 Tax=Jhaorihella thermophila TaxID=488547 RepID=UPI00361B5212
MTIRSILCALDLSQPEIDDRPLLVAADLARHHGAQLDVMTVVPSFGVGEVSSFFPEGYQDEAREAARERLVAHVAEVLGAEETPGCGTRWRWARSIARCCAWPRRPAVT